MKARTAGRIESAILAGASAIFGSAVGFALYRLANGSALAAALSGGGSFASCLGLLRKVDAGTRRGDESAARTAIREILAEADRSLADDKSDVAAEASRVVQLFDAPRAIAGSPPPARGDASQALYEALSELRRTLR